VAEIPAKELALVIDGRQVDLKKPSKLNFELNKALAKPEGFRAFADDPEGFASGFDLKLDPDIAAALKNKLVGINDLNDLKDLLKNPQPINPQAATLWAVAEGAYSVASSKVAVAF
jgi:hypothetical protein